MDHNSYTKVGTQGKITATIRPHTDEFRKRKYDASVPHRSGRLYPGGGTNQNHWILDGELVFGNRSEQYKYSELGFSSLSGLSTRDLGQLANSIYFMGVSVAQAKFGGDNIYNDPENNQALTVDKAGTRTIIINGPFDIFAGDLVAWMLPDPKKKHYRLKNEPANKWRPLIVPFDRTILRLDASQMLDAMNPNPSVAETETVTGQTYEDLLDFHKTKFDEDRMTPNQMEAAGFKYGLALMFIKGMQHLVADPNSPVDQDEVDRLIDNMGLFGINNTDENKDTFAHNLIEAMVDSTPSNDPDATGYDKYNNRALQLWDNSRSEAFKSKTSRIIGKAMNTADARGGTLDIMLGHTKIY